MVEWLTRRFPAEVGGEAEDVGRVRGTFWRNDAVPVLMLRMVVTIHAAPAGHVALA